MLPIEPGAPLGPVRLGKVLRKGTWSHLYEAHHARLGVNVTVRVLHAPPAEDRERFEREAAISHALGHPAVVPAIDFGEHGNLRYLISERISGRSLEQYLAEHRDPPTEAAIVKLIGRVVDTLAVCHSVGLGHRDLEPEKLLLDPQGQLRIVDFGFAPATGFPVGPCGSMRELSPYVPPECARGDHPVEPSADLFSLGVIAYQLAFQRLPYGHWSDYETVEVEALEPAPFDLPTHCSLPLLHVIRALIEPQPGTRLDDTDDLLGLLPTLTRPSVRSMPLSPQPEEAPRVNTLPPSDPPVRDPLPKDNGEFHGFVQVLQRWLGSSTTEHDAELVVHSTLRERLLVWGLLVVLAVAATAAALVSVQ